MIYCNVVFEDGGKEYCYQADEEQDKKLPSFDKTLTWFASSTLKPDIDGMFSPKTTNQIWMLRKKFTGQSIFDRTDIMATLDKKCPEHRSW